ncbi:MAG: M23 family metallopeptidase [Myxococcota bacterium]
MPLVIAVGGTCATEEHSQRRRAPIVLEPIVLAAPSDDVMPVSDDMGMRGEEPSPIAARVEVVGDGVGPGRAAAFVLRIEGSSSGFSQLAAGLGGRRAVVLPLDPERQEMMLVAPVHLEERRSSLALEVEGELRDGTHVLLSRSFEVTPIRYRRRDLRVGTNFLGSSSSKPARAKGERLGMRAVLSKHTEDLPWEGGFLHPTASAETAAFGTRRLLNGVQRSRHMGWDLDGKVGDPVHATQAGRVVVAARLFYSGGTVILDHGQGLFSLYFHLSALDVKKGQTVHRAQRVGRVGRSGRVTGPHLHFAFKLDGVYVDPERLLALPWPGTYDEGQHERPLEKRPIRVTAGVPSVSRAGASVPIGSATHKEPS